MTQSNNLNEIMCITDKVTQDYLLKTMGINDFFTSRVFIDSLNVETEIWFALIKGKAIIASLIQTKSGHAVDSQEGYIKYQGLLISESVKKWSNDRIHHILLPNIDKLLSRIEDHHPNGLSLSLSPSMLDIRPFLWRSKWIVTPKYTAIIEIDKFNTFQQYLKTIRESTKQVSKHLEKKGYTIGMGSIEDLIKLYHSSLARQNIIPSNEFISTLKNIGKSAQKNSSGETLLIYTPEGLPVSGILIVYNKYSAYIITAGTDQKWRSSGVGSALWLACIRRCFDRGLQRIDFLGANNQGRAGFKAGFSADLQLYFEVNFKGENK